jgi:hypothetical protein
VLYDVESRKTVAQDHADSLRVDFRAPSHPLRVAIGRRLVQVGRRLAHEPLASEEPLRLVYASPRRPLAVSSGAPARRSSSLRW